MKTNIYKITIHKNGHFLQMYWFIGAIPTQDELLEIIKRRASKSLVQDVLFDADCSIQIVKQIGIPDEIGPCTGKKWLIMDIEVGKITVEREEAWTVSTFLEKSDG